MLHSCNIAEESLELAKQLNSEQKYDIDIATWGCLKNAPTEHNLPTRSLNINTLILTSQHWLRHTGISDDVKHRPREHVRDDAGHSSSAITDKYIDIERRERHRTARRKKIKPELLEDE